jgi:dienelactone hydrolase
MVSAVLLGAGLLLAQGSPPVGHHGCAPAPAPVVGTVCSPNDGAQHPAIIVLGGSEGGDSMSHTAAEFARHGYVAMSVAYFGVARLPQTLVNVPVETIGTAIATLQKRSDVEGAHIGILGMSKGGELALLAASTYPQLKAVVAVVPSPYAYMGLGQGNVPDGCSWSKNGEPLPCIPPDQAAGAQIGNEFAQHQPVSFKPLYDASRAADPAVTAAALFPLAHIAGPVLCLAAQGDQIWNSPAHCDVTMQTLKAAAHRFADREILYPNAGHMFLFATRGPSSAINNLSQGPVTIAFGGTPAGDTAAATEAWSEIWSFLGTAL